MISEVLLSHNAAGLWGAAISPDGLVGFVAVEHEADPQVNDIFMGVVSRVITDLGFAFIDLGLDRAGVLPLKETRHSQAFAHLNGAQLANEKKRSGLQVGQRLLVQLVRLEEGDKGIRVSRRLSLASRYQIYLPGGQGVYFSKAIDQESARRELITFAEQQSQRGGRHFRGPAACASQKFLAEDFDRLADHWQSLVGQIDQLRVGFVKRVTPIVSSWLDAWGADIRCRIQVDSDILQQQVLAWSQSLHEPSSPVTVISPDDKAAYTQDFDRLLEVCLTEKIELPSGGNMIIHETEAMVTIDVNSGSYVSNAANAQKARCANLEAARVIPMALRRKGLAGLVAIDFIGLIDQRDRQEIIDVLSEVFLEQGQAVRVSDFSDLGVVLLSLYKSGPSVFKRLQSRGLIWAAGESFSHLVSQACALARFKAWLDSQLLTTCLGGGHLLVRSSAVIITGMIQDVMLLQQLQQGAVAMKFEVDQTLERVIKVRQEQVWWQFPEESLE